MHHFSGRCRIKGKGAFASEDEIEALRKELLRCSSHTQSLIQPLLGEELVQTLLLSFIADKSRTFQEWIKYTAIQEKLRNFRALMEEGGQGFLGHAVEVVKEAKRDQQILEIPMEDTWDLVMRIAETKLDSGRKYFASDEFHEAADAFKGAAAQLKSLALSHQGGEKVACTYVKCLCNAAVASYHEGLLGNVPSLCSEALKVDPCCPKAFYWRGKSNLERGLCDIAFQDLSRAAEIAPRDANIKKEHMGARKRLVKLEEDRQEAQKQRMKRALRFKEEKETALMMLEDKPAPISIPIRNCDFPSLKIRPPSGEELTLLRKTPITALLEYCSKMKVITFVERYEVLPVSEENQHMTRGYGSIPNMFSVTCEAKKKKTCKHGICEALLKQLWRVWNIQNPDGKQFDVSYILPTSFPPLKTETAAAATAEPETTAIVMRNWAKQWLNIIIDGDCQRLNFPGTLSKAQRREIQSLVEGVKEETGIFIMSTSYKGSLDHYRRLHVFTRDERSHEIDVPCPPLLPPLNREELRKLIHSSD